MRVVQRLADITQGQPFATTIGAFDGVHVGHQALFRTLRQQAEQHDAHTLVITFTPDPAEVILAQPPPCLTSIEQRLELIQQLGMDEVCLLPFDAHIRDMSAQAFMDQLIGACRLVELVVGHDFAMGHDRQGTRSVLEAYAQAHGFAFAVAEALLVQGQPASASRIRRLLANADLDSANAMLGRPHCISGIVVDGDKRGRLLGFPTANLGLDQHWAIPADGIYVAHTRVRNQVHESVVNIGMRPTFDAKQRTIESHILEFNSDIYGEPISVAFLARLRAEERFASVDALREQIGRDVESGRAYFRRLASNAASA